MLDEVARLVSDSEGSAAGHLLATWLNELAEQAGGELRSSILSMADDASPSRVRCDRTGRTAAR